MRILVDADACPVKHIIVKVAKEYRIPVIRMDFLCRECFFITDQKK